MALHHAYTALTLSQEEGLQEPQPEVPGIALHPGAGRLQFGTHPFQNNKSRLGQYPQFLVTEGQ